MKKTKAVTFILIGWIILIGGFILFKEYSLWTGTSVYLETAPVDPRDIFRGDYVTLSYKISNFNPADFKKQAQDFPAGENIYVLLKTDEKNIAKPIDITRTPPDEGLFIKGLVMQSYENNIRIQYGIESYFVPEGTGKELEENLNHMLGKVTIDERGNSIITDLILEQ